MPNPFASVVIRAAAILAVLCIQSSAVLARDDDISRAVSTCASHANSIWLREDETILCFDSRIAQVPTDQIQKLKDHGFFVVRSPGGYPAPAMAIADILLEKDATVIVHDYCLSACANYILVATKRTYVVTHSVVAWHGGPGNARCGDTSPYGEIGFSRYLPASCKDVALQTLFFAKRGIEPRYVFSPQTTYTRMMFHTLMKVLAKKSEILWMWNPGNYGDHFKGRVVYEQYPGSQYEVDRITDRFFHLAAPGQIIFDPRL